MIKYPGVTYGNMSAFFRNVNRQWGFSKASVDYFRLVYIIALIHSYKYLFFVSRPYMAMTKGIPQNANIQYTDMTPLDKSHGRKNP